MPVPAPTVDELVSTIARSSLPTIVVEGTSDVNVYRYLERRLARPGSVLPTNGRSKLLAVYERRQEFPGVATAFLADRDLWLFETIPTKYSDIVFTNGYSIENDVFDGPAAVGLLDSDEQTTLGVILQELAKWFAHEVESHLAGGQAILEVSLNTLVPKHTATLCELWKLQRGFRDPSGGEIHTRVAAEPQRYVRGKQVAQLFARLLNAPGRSAKHSPAGLVEICATNPEHHSLERIAVAIDSALAAAVEKLRTA